LYSLSIGFSFLFTGIFVKSKYSTLEEIKKEEDEERKMINYMDELNFEYKYLDEINKLKDTSVSDLVDISEKYTTLEIPFLKATIIMYYEDGVFYYYCNTDVIYKYLNVACRKFVIEHNVINLYVEKTDSEEIKQQSVSSALFVTKQESTLLEKKMNKFIRVGSIHDYEAKNLKKKIKEIKLSDFLNSR